MCVTQTLSLVFIVIRVMHSASKGQSFINSWPAHLWGASRPLFREKVGASTWRCGNSSCITNSKHGQIIFIIDIELHPISILNFPNFFVEFNIIVIIEINSKRGLNHFLPRCYHFFFSTSFHEEMIDKTEGNREDHHRFLHYLVYSSMAFFLWQLRSKFGEISFTLFLFQVFHNFLRS